jgi:type IV pilus assembly protein PilV
MKPHVSLLGSREAGVSLIEVLVAMVILSIGLLGIAGLQLTSLRFTHDVNLGYQAGVQANDMADRIRANPIGWHRGDYNNISGMGSDPGCIRTGCTPAQIAATDAFEWNNANARLLPNGRGVVQSQSGQTTITLLWQEMTPLGPLDRSYSLVISP